MRLQAQVDQLRMLRVVIMGFGFHARVGDMVNFNAQAHFFASRLHFDGKIENRELLGELVIDSTLTFVGWVQTSKFNTPYSVANVQESARLAAFAIHGERL